MKQRYRVRFIQPAKPNQNAYIERFNRTYRDEVLDAYLFDDLHQVRSETEKFIWKYNNICPRDSLDNVTPRAFLLSIPHSKGFMITMTIIIFECNDSVEAYARHLAQHILLNVDDYLTIFLLIV